MKYRNFIGFKSRIFWSAFLALAILLSPYSAVFAASTPSVLSYQGRLTDASGNLLGGSGNTYYFKFSLWDAASNGNQLWPALPPNSFATTVRQGVFNVNIGDTSAGFPDALDFNFGTPDTYLQVEVSSDDVSFETLTPRQRISSAAYAQMAGAVVSASSTITTLTNTSLTNTYSTSTNATTTNLFATLASTTNLFGTVINGFGLTTCNGGTSALIWANGSFGCHVITGGGGSGGGTWSTTTSQVLGQLINYPNNVTDIAVIGSNATNTAPFYFDPNLLDSFITNTRIGKSTTTSATSTNLFSTTATFTNLFANTANLTESGNLFFTQSRFDAALEATTTLSNLAVLKGVTDLIVTRSTTTNATTTNLFTTTASTTNLYGTSINGFGLTSCTGGAQALRWSNGSFT
ncbi:hypothetical protein KW790_02590, partial [Candidatus Parcubacteria bacterium]|nr:hypothetical protein [Candidatus Parcubacteria bacterium]